jgi:hypothetical protein
MKLWLISQDQNGGYDTYDSAVVAADNEIDAAHTHPAMRMFEGGPVVLWSTEAKMWVGHRQDGSTYAASFGDWVAPDAITVHYIGEAAEDIGRGCITSSFNAG